MSDADRIQELLSRSPGLKAQQIASQLGIERSLAVTTLHGLLGSAVVQDSAYRWWPRAPLPQVSGETPASQPRTFPASLGRYYLECLARESGSGISLPAAETAGYVPLDRLPFAGQAAEPWGPAAPSAGSSRRPGGSAASSRCMPATRCACEPCRRQRGGAAD
jgi:hypothetical protein